MDFVQRVFAEGEKRKKLENRAKKGEC